MYKPESENETHKILWDFENENIGGMNQISPIHPKAWLIDQFKRHVNQWH